MVALGYVHAQDRLWQMELMRRIAPGRLSELFWKSGLKE
jgi:penicillin amidase